MRSILILSACAATAAVGVLLLPAPVAIPRLERSRVQSATWKRRAEALDERVRLMLLGASMGVGASILLRQANGAILLAVLGAMIGYLLAQHRTQTRARSHEREVVEHLPVVIEMLALAVSAGEAPASALARIAAEGHGLLLQVLRGAVSDLALGSTLMQALAVVRERLPYPDVDRFIEGINAGQERGTPLAEVLHAQAWDARERQRRALIEKAASSEVAMMIPVVFLIMPVTIVFALFPSFYHMTWM